MRSCIFLRKRQRGKKSHTARDEREAGKDERKRDERMIRERKEREREREKGKREKHIYIAREKEKHMDRYQIMKTYEHCHTSTEKQTALRADSGLGPRGPRSEDGSYLLA